jgi:HEAT repeat protein
MSEELEFVLRRLSDDGKPVRSISLAPLSDLSREQVGLFRQTWAGLNDERRLELITELVEQAEANVQFNFTAILRDCLLDGDARVRKLAVEGLWEDNKPGLVVPLATMLSGDPSAEVRAAAASSLGRFVLMGELGEVAEQPARQAYDALRAAWFRPGEPNDVRRRALEGMSYAGGRAVQELIDNAYYDEDESMRQSAVFAMGRSGDGRWTKSVLAELGSQDAAMRFEAAASAGEMGLSAAVRPLIVLLDDPDSNVREAAALALGQIGGPDARRALEACVAGDDDRLAQAAEEALEELNFNAGSIDQPLFDFDTAETGPLAALSSADRAGGFDIDDVIADDELGVEYDDEALGDDFDGDLFTDEDGDGDDWLDDEELDDDEDLDDDDGEDGGDEWG